MRTRAVDRSDVGREGRLRVQVEPVVAARDPAAHDENRVLHQDRLELRVRLSHEHDGDLGLEVLDRDHAVRISARLRDTVLRARDETGNGDLVTVIEDVSDASSSAIVDAAVLGERHLETRERVIRDVQPQHVALERELVLLRALGRSGTFCTSWRLVPQAVEVEPDLTLRLA